MYEAKKRGRNCVVCAEDSDKFDFNQVELELPVKAVDEQPIVVN
jgi:hypothetical protein